MANYATLKANVQQVIKTNANNEITGALLQSTLLSMITSLGANYQFAGVASPSTNPGTPDQNVFYITKTGGTYSNFGGLVVLDKEVAVLKYNGSWTKESFGAVSVSQFDEICNILGVVHTNFVITSAFLFATDTVTKVHVPQGQKFTILATSDGGGIPKLNAVYVCDSAGGNRTTLRNNLVLGTTYEFTAATNIEYLCFYCDHVTPTSVLTIDIRFALISELQALIGTNGIVNTNQQIALANIGKGDVFASLVQGGYSNGIPNTAATRVRFNRMFSIDEFPIQINIPDDVDVQIYGISTYAVLNDYTSFISYQAAIQRYLSKKEIIQKELFADNVKGVSIMFSKMSNNSANLSPTDMATVKFTHYDKTQVLSSDLGRLAFMQKRIDTVGLGSAYAVFPCKLKQGSWYLLETESTSSASEFTMYACDSSGNNRTNIKGVGTINLGGKFLFQSPVNTDFCTIFIASGVTTPGDFVINVYDALLLRSYLDDIGNSGIRDGNFLYYGDSAISLYGKTKAFMGKREIIISRNYDASDFLRYNQSMAINGGKIFFFQDTSIADVRNSGQSIVIYDLETLTQEATANNPVSAHCNNAQFTNIYYSSSDPFPLLMLSNGDYPNENSPYFHFIRISKSGTTYAFTIIKTITCSVPEAIYNGSWVGNFRQKRLFMYTFTIGTWQTPESQGNKIAIFEFAMPDITDPTPVTLSVSDVKRYSLMDYFIAQGADEHGGLLYMPGQALTKINGLPFDGISGQTNALLVINPDLGRVVNVVPFMGPEPEGCAQYGGDIYISQKYGGATSGQLAFQLQKLSFYEG